MKKKIAEKNSDEKIEKKKNAALAAFFLRVTPVQILTRSWLVVALLRIGFFFGLGFVNRGDELAVGGAARQAAFFGGDF